MLGSSNCSLCDPGYACPDPAAPPEKCAVGSYAAGAAFECEPCLPGYRCPEGSVNAAPLGSEREAARTSNLQPDANVRICDSFDERSSTMLRYLGESHRFVRK